MTNLRAGRRFEIQNKLCSIWDPAFRLARDGTINDFLGGGQGNAVRSAEVDFVAEPTRFPTRGEQRCLGMRVAIFTDFPFVHWAAKHLRVLQVRKQAALRSEPVIGGEAPGQWILAATRAPHF